MQTYKESCQAQHAVLVVVYFSEDEKRTAERTLKDIGLWESRDLVLIDAAPDNKPSGSRAKNRRKPTRAT